MFSGAEPSKVQRQSADSPVVQVGAKVERLRTGFYNISGGAVDSVGQLLLCGRALATYISLVALGEAAFGCSRQRRRIRRTLRSISPAI